VSFKKDFAETGDGKSAISAKRIQPVNGTKALPAKDSIVPTSTRQIFNKLSHKRIFKGIPSGSSTRELGGRQGPPLAKAALSTESASELIKGAASETTDALNFTGKITKENKERGIKEKKIENRQRTTLKNMEQHKTRSNDQQKTNSNTERQHRSAPLFNTIRTA